MSVAAIEIGELARMLDQQARTLAPELLPNGRQMGAYWRSGSIADEPGESLAVNLNGPRIGLWTDFSAPERTRERSGDLLKLVALVKFGGELRDAIAWARSTLGLDGLDPKRLATRRAEAAERARDADAAAAVKAEDRRRTAMALFLGAVPIAGTPAELYLATRGIDLSLLDAPPRALRYNAAVRCEEAAGRALPALVAAVIGLDGAHVATHRIWIEPDGQGGARKCRGLAEPKKVIGRYWGGHIPLNKGPCKATLRDVPAGTEPSISEGIEDGMTVACACPERRVIAAVTLGNIGALALPDQVRGLTIVAQRDPPGSPAEAALAKAIAARQAEGRTVRRALPPPGVKDANDLALGLRQGGGGVSGRAPILGPSLRGGDHRARLDYARDWHARHEPMFDAMDAEGWFADSGNRHPRLRKPHRCPPEVAA